MKAIAIWQGLPDPRPTDWMDTPAIDVIVDEVGFWHFACKHFGCVDEGWADLLGEEFTALATSYRGRERSFTSEHRTAIERALAVVGQQVAEALQRPTVVIAPIEPPPPTTEGQLGRWLLVLPFGAYAWTQRKGAQIFLRSCYVPQIAFVEEGEEGRWKRVIRQLVRDNARFDEATRSYLPPTNRLTRFVTLAAWGFDINKPNHAWHSELFQKHGSRQDTTPSSLFQLLPRTRPRPSNDD